MKFITVFFLAFWFSTHANAADLSVWVEEDYNTDFPPNPLPSFMEVLPFGGIDFKNVCLDSQRVFKVRVRNEGDELSDFTVSLSGNQKEVYIIDVTDPKDCSTLPKNEYCDFDIVMLPMHHGIKRKKLNIDGVDMSLNDVSLTIPVVGTSNPFNSSLDSRCYPLPSN